MASQVVVFGFDEEQGAETMLDYVDDMQKEGLLELEDAVIASRGPGTDVDIRQMHSKAGKFALRGSGIGLLAGLLLGGPIGGLIGGAAIGGITGALKDHGLDDSFVEEVSGWVRPNTSALFLLIAEAKGEQVLPRLQSLNARVLTTTLPEEAEKRLRESLAAEA
jgi:uncharacterized membrane protein